MNHTTFKPQTSFLLNKPNLKQSILAKNKKIDVKVLDELETLVDKYKLSWVPASTGNNAHFLCSEVLKAVGKDDNYFKTTWTKNKKDVIDRYFEYGVLPRLENVKGAALNYIRDAWLHYNDKDVSDNDGWVLEWSITHWILTTFTKNNILSFAKDSLIVQRKGPCLGNEDDEYLYNDYLEDNLRLRIVELASYQSKIKLVQEFTLDNTILKSNTNVAKTRRIDLLEYKPNRSYVAYELKLSMITADHVKEALGDKGYLELLRKRFKGRKIKFYFMSPKGISPEAKRLISNNPYVDFIPVSKLVNKLINVIRSETPDAGRWFFVQKFKELFPQNVTKVNL